MKSHTGFYFASSAAALGLAMIASAPVALAQEVITRQIVDQPVETVVAQRPFVTVPAAAVIQPTETVQTTTRTVRTVRPAPSRNARRQVVTTRTVTQRILPAPTVVARTVPAVRQPLYDEVVPAPLASAAPAYTPPLYDTTVVPAAAMMPVAATTPLVQGGSIVATEPFIYRYVYEPDRILVVDPNTGVAVQAIPR